MERYERICPVEYAGGLDSRARKWLQNPAKILNGRVREGMASCNWAAAQVSSRPRSPAWSANRAR